MNEKPLAVQYLIKWFIFFCVCPLVLSSCYSAKNLVYFEDLKDTSKIYTQVIQTSYEAHIQPDDIVEIIINSINPQATAIFNLGNSNPVSVSSNAVVTSNSTSSGATGYLVDKNGIIDFPVLGKLDIKGLTVSMLKDTLARKLNKYLQDPIINARILNYKFTVLGEVNSPSAYTLPGERISIIDAIGLAGDLTIYGRRENILLIREEAGERKFVRLNLNSTNIFQSPYYYLKQNDVLYVEPNKPKIASTDIQTVRNLSILTTGISIIAILYSVLHK